MVRHADVLDSAIIAEHYRIFADAERVIADPIVRNRGTVGGSLCQADPSEDLSAAFAAVRASVALIGRDGATGRAGSGVPRRTVRNRRRSDEMLVEVRIPVRPGGCSAYEKVERRVGDWAIAAAGAAVWLDGDTISEVGIGLTAVEAPHFVAAAAEDAARGRVRRGDRCGRSPGFRSMQPVDRPAGPCRLQTSPGR